jgi:hypothetical protein
MDVDFSSTRKITLRQPGQKAKGSFSSNPRLIVTGGKKDRTLRD